MSKRKIVRSPSPSVVKSESAESEKTFKLCASSLPPALSLPSPSSTATSTSISTSPRNFSKFGVLKDSDDPQEDGNVNKEARKLQQKNVTHFRKENLNLDYTILYDRKKAKELMSRCESEIVYNDGHLAQVRIFGKWIDIPRKQVAFGDPGLTYTFSGNTVPAKPWTPLLLEIRNDISKNCGFDFNFVLVNRYQDGNDYMGEHKDDEKDLCPGYPIASLSLGQQRDFIFKHQDCRGKNAKRKMDKLTIQLENGSLLMMNAPTNSFWYHCLPKRPKVLGMRLNFTFRKMVPSLCKPVKSIKDYKS